MDMSTDSKQQNKLNTIDNAELRYCVRVSDSLFSKIKFYFKLRALGKDLITAIITDEHDWKDQLIIGDETYEVAYRECSYAYIANALVDKRYLLSVRRAKDNRTKIVLIVPWDSYAAKFAITNADNIPWMEY